MKYLQSFLEDDETPPRNISPTYPQGPVEPVKQPSTGSTGTHLQVHPKIGVVDPLARNISPTYPQGPVGPVKLQDGLIGPRRTPWGTAVSSVPAAPPLERFGPPARGPALAERRWGPALGDATPGIVLDRPDRDRMRATREAAARAADPEARAERAAIQAEPLDEDLTSLHAIIAGWSLAWRERWGRLANELAEQGVPHPDDERQAYTTTLSELEAGAEPPPLATPPAAPAAPVRWRRCHNRFCLHHEAGWWASAWGVINCLNCVPPAFPELVVAQDTAANAPLVDPLRTNQAIGPVDGRAAWPQVGNKAFT